VFEGERVYEGQIFKLREHSERLIKSAELVGMKIPMSVEEIEEASKLVAEENNITNGYIRPIAWRGSEHMAVSAEGCSVHVAFACWEWPQYFFPKNDEEGGGIALGTSRWVRPDPRSMPVQSKCAGGYAVGTMAKQEANDAGFDDALMHDYTGKVAESTGSNLFVVEDNAIRTPVADCFLNGITRQTIIQLAKDIGYSVEETTIMPEELLKADEVFVTGTAAEVTPVGRIDDHSYGKERPVTNRLIEAYADMVRGKTTVSMAS
jgi:branched-chain amino acid aminotransferase